jgi:hypothetical protein
MALFRKRRGIDEIVTALLLVAIVVGMGVLAYAFASGSFTAFAQGAAGLVSGQGNSAAEDFVVEQVAFEGSGLEALPITLANSQTSATPASFQQMITWDPATYSTYEATNLGNIRFCSSSSCATELFAWLESCSGTCSTGGSTSTSATAWVDLGSLTVAANGGTLTIYMVFESTSTTFDGDYWGEAPQLSPIYAEYDNGANVFAAYFDGNTPTSDFTVFTGLALGQAASVTGPGATTINAIQITGNTAAHDPSFSFDTALSNTGLIVETSFALAADTGDATGTTGLVNSATANSITNGISVGMGDGGDYFYQGTDIASAINIPLNGAGAAPAAATWLYSSLTYTGAGEASFYAQTTPALYGVPGQTAATGYSGTETVANPLSAATDLYMGSIGGLAAVNVEYNFMRARYYPPAGVMPTVTPGTPSSSSPGADLYVRNTGTLSSNLVSVFIVDESTGALVGQVPISSTVSAGALVDISHLTYTGLDFSPTAGEAYFFKVTSSLGNSATYIEVAP